MQASPSRSLVERPYINTLAKRSNLVAAVFIPMSSIKTVGSAKMEYSAVGGSIICLLSRMKFSLSTCSSKVTLTVFYVLAILATLYRIYNRCRTHRFWWDDFLATVSLLFTCGLFIVLWLGFGIESFLVTSQ